MLAGALSDLSPEHREEVEATLEERDWVLLGGPPARGPRTRPHGDRLNLRVPIRSGPTTVPAAVHLYLKLAGYPLDIALAAGLAAGEGDEKVGAEQARRSGGVTRVGEVMSSQVVVVDTTTPLEEAARRMRDADVGDVIVVENGRPAGILTDRDLVVRAIAADRDPRITTAGAAMRRPLETVTPEAPVDDAVRLMRTRAIRRLVVVDGGLPVGVLSLSDVAVMRQPDSVLAEIAGAPSS